MQYYHRCYLCGYNGATHLIEESYVCSACYHIMTGNSSISIAKKLLAVRRKHAEEIAQQIGPPSNQEGLDGP